MIDVFVSEYTGLIDRTEKYRGDKIPFRLVEALDSPITIS
jgi:hypothetical protein